MRDAGRRRSTLELRDGIPSAVIVVTLVAAAVDALAQHPFMHVHREIMGRTHSRTLLALRCRDQPGAGPGPESRPIARETPIDEPQEGVDVEWFREPRDNLPEHVRLLLAHGRHDDDWNVRELRILLLRGSKLPPAGDKVKA